MMRPGSSSTALEGTHCTTVDEIQTNVMGQLKHLTVDEFAKCLDSGGDNVEVYNV